MRQLSSPRNPFRPVDWRWERSRQIVDGELPYGPRRDDPWVRRAAEFRARRAACATELDYALLAEDEPDLYWAHQIYGQAGRDTREGAFRFEIEARVLADEPAETIAARTGLEVEDVLAYEALFFDARCKLHTPAYILHMVIGPAIHRGLNSRDYDLLWKLGAYTRGGRYLDALVSTFGSDRKSVLSGDVASAMAEDQAFDVLRASMVAAKTFRIHSESQADAIDLYCKLKEIERRDGSGFGSTDAITESVRAFFEANRFKIGPPEKGTPEAAADADVDYEMTSEQMVAAAAGADPEIDAEFASVKFPEPNPIEVNG